MKKAIAVILAATLGLSVVPPVSLAQDKAAEDKKPSRAEVREKRRAEREERRAERREKREARRQERQERREGRREGRARPPAAEEKK